MKPLTWYTHTYIDICIYIYICVCVSVCVCVCVWHTPVTEVVHEDDFAEEVCRGAVNDWTYSSKQGGPGFVMEANDDASGGKIGIVMNGTAGWITRIRDEAVWGQGVTRALIEGVALQNVSWAIICEDFGGGILGPATTMLVFFFFN